jgi:hypothetical protein
MYARGIVFDNCISNSTSFRMWFVLLTDGQDTTSQSTLQETCAYLAQLNAQLGGIARFVFIGVKLDGNATRELQSLDAAAGLMSTFRTVSNLATVGAIFQEIAASISAEHLRVTGVQQRYAHICDGTRNCPGGHGLKPVW